MAFLPAISSRPLWRLFPTVLLSAAALLSGCSAGMTDTAQSSSTTAILRGTVHGGAQPISGAEVFWYAAGAGGYGTSARAVLTTPVTTDASGNFSFPSGTTCQAGDEVYVLATGGTPGGATTANGSIALAAALGSCSGLSSSTSIQVNEVTTVAAAYGLAGFMNSATGLSSSGTTLALTGVKNAFLNAANLASVASGSANATTVGGNGTVPAAEINTLGNILAACVSATGTRAACNTLFTAATPPGGTAPTDTLSAALDIAHNPGQNVATLFGLNSGTAPFKPSLASAPHDWSVAVTYTGGGIGLDSSKAVFPARHVALDGLGNVWVTSVQGISVLDPAGNPLSPATGFTAGLFPGDLVYTIAIDRANNAWAVTSKTGLIKIDSAGTLLSPPGGYPGNLTGFSNMTFDSFGNLWVAGEQATAATSEFNSSGVALSPDTGYPGPPSQAGYYLYYPSLTADSSGHVWWVYDEYGQGGTLTTIGSYCGADSYWATPAVDADGNIWTSYPGTPYQVSAARKCSPTGDLLSPSDGFPLSPVSTSTYGLAVDGSNRIWMFDSNFSGHLGVMDTEGNLLAPAGGYQMEQDTGNVAEYMALDSSGNAWISSEGVTLVEFVGIATPVATPLATALATKSLGARP